VAAITRASVRIVAFRTGMISRESECARSLAGPLQPIRRSRRGTTFTLRIQNSPVLLLVAPVKAPSCGRKRDSTGQREVRAVAATNSRSAHSAHGCAARVCPCPSRSRRGWLIEDPTRRRDLRAARRTRPALSDERGRRSRTGGVSPSSGACTDAPMSPVRSILALDAGSVHEGAVAAPVVVDLDAEADAGTVACRATALDQSIAHRRRRSRFVRTQFEPSQSVGRQRADGSMKDITDQSDATATQAGRPSRSAACAGGGSASRRIYHPDPRKPPHRRR